jgi:hypothetical protein
LLSELSITELVESKGFEASLIATFNASLPFCEAARPKQAGFDYSLIPTNQLACSYD